MSADWIAACPSSLRDVAARYWYDRVASEAETGEAFERLESHLMESGVAEPVLAMVRAAPAEERAHARRCLELAASYAGTPPPPLPVARARARAPRLSPPIEDREDLLYSITALCCINETLAVPLIQHMRACSGPEPLVRFQSHHLRDELGHARIGWAHLGSAAIADEDRALVADALPALLEANLERWRCQVAALPEVERGHGIPGEPGATRVLRDALHHVVLPGFDHVRISTRAARDWVAGQPWLAL